MTIKKSKCQRVKDHLLDGYKITGLDAIRDFGLYRLSSTIHDLRKDGFDIRTNMIEKNGVRFAEYELVGKIDD